MSIGSCCPEPDKKLHMRLDIRKVSMVGDVSLGDEVTVTVVGKITSMRGPEESLYTDSKNKEHKNVYPGSLEVEVSKVKLAPNGAFSAMDEDD